MTKCHGVAQIITVATELVGVSSLLWVIPVQNKGMETNTTPYCKASGTVHMVLREVAVEFEYSWTFYPIPLVFFSSSPSMYVHAPNY